MAGQWRAVSKRWCMAVQILLWWPTSSWLAGRNPVLFSCLHHFSGYAAGWDFPHLTGHKTEPQNGTWWGERGSSSPQSPWAAISDQRLMLPPWLWQSQASQAWPGGSMVQFWKLCVYTEIQAKLPPSICLCWQWKYQINNKAVWCSGAEKRELAFDLSVSFTVSLTNILNSSRITCGFTSLVTWRWCRLAQAIFLSWRNCLRFFAKDSSGN